MEGSFDAMRALVVMMVVAACSPAAVGPAKPSPSWVDAYLGIPYARAERWEAPVVLAWEKRDTSKRGPACPQPEEGVHRDTSEDCLNLNVWTPYGARKAPVFVWIHGGGFYQGSGGDSLYDGERFARRTGAVVVTINYRLGALGFISFRERGAMPAVGLLDQQAALEWVKQNIARYGGDPGNVTIAGESAGGWSVCSHLAMPRSRGLFARAMVMSGACSDALYKTAEEANAQGDELMKAVGCADVACLKGKPADELVTALKYRRGLLLQPGVWWGPTVDGVALPKEPLVAMRAGEEAKVPLMIGTARDEGTLHVMFYKDVSADELAWFARTTFGDRSESAILAKYAGRPPKEALSALVSEGIFRCNARRVARVMSRSAPVYLYEWTHALNGPPEVHALGPTHSIDLFFLFGMIAEGLGADQAEQPLVRTFEDMVGDFARTGNPGHDWPSYDARSDRHEVLDVPAGHGAGLDREVCDFWDSQSRF